ncbi:MAG: hypothetical protein HYT80_03145 [Euryarchaeota archaeon]|nr:hypothetical protein [Euryarchaeota archaeon]
MAAAESLFFLDTAAILEAVNLEAARCRTAPEVVAEVRPGGATGRRLEQMLAAGLLVVAATPEGRMKVQAAAKKAGSLARLSEADVSILALSVDLAGSGELLSDDYTVLDVAKRLGIAARPVTKEGIGKTKDWAARCRGCGRRYGAGAAGTVCRVCGAEVRLVPRRG